MKHRITVIPVFILVILLCCQCSIEKRLYNRGFYVERNHRCTSKKASFEKPSDSISQMAEVVKSDDVKTFPLWRGPGGGQSESINDLNDLSESDSIVSQSENSIPITETRRSKVPYTIARKRDVLVRYGFLVLGTGGAAGLILAEATAGGAQFGAMVIGGLIGWPLALLAAILLVIFLVYLCIPPIENRNQVPEEDRQFNKGERAGLIIAGIFAFVILIAFVSPLVNG